MPKSGDFLLPSLTIADTLTLRDLDEEQKAFLETVAGFVKGEVFTADALRRIGDKDYEFTRRLIAKMAELGIMAIDIPEEFGGLDLGTVYSCLAAFEFGREASLAATVGASGGIGTMPIVLFGTPEQKAKYLPRLASGEWVSAFALTEKGAGSDAAGVETKARWDAVQNCYLLSGTKQFITNGAFADMFLVFARGEGSPRGVLTAFIVERGFGGITSGKEEDKMGIRGSSTTEVVFENVSVPAENLLGEKDKGLKIALTALNLGRLKLGAGTVGAARLCLERAQAYARERKQFGAPINSFAPREYLALMAARIFAMEAVVLRSAALTHAATLAAHANATDSNAVPEAVRRYTMEDAAVKVFCSDTLCQIANDAIQTHGGYGYCKDYGVEGYYRDARINRIFEGTNEINTLVVLGEFSARLADAEFMAHLKRYLRESGRPTYLLRGYLDELMGVIRPPREEGDMASLHGRLNRVKKAVLLAGGAFFKNVIRLSGGDAKDKKKVALETSKHPVPAMLAGRNVIDMYVLDSVLAAAVKDDRPVARLYAKLMFGQILPAMETRVRELFTWSLPEKMRRGALAMTHMAFAHVPDDPEAVVNGIFAELEKT